MIYIETLSSSSLLAPTLLGSRTCTGDPPLRPLGPNPDGWRESPTTGHQMSIPAAQRLAGRLFSCFVGTCLDMGGESVYGASGRAYERLRWSEMVECDGCGSWDSGLGTPVRAAKEL